MYLKLRKFQVILIELFFRLLISLIIIFHHDIVYIHNRMLFVWTMLAFKFLTIMIILIKTITITVVLKLTYFDRKLIPLLTNF